MGPAPRSRRRSTAAALSLALVLSVLSLGQGGPAQSQPNDDQTQPYDARPSKTQEDRPAYVQGEILVRFEPGTPAQQKQRARNEHGLQKQEDLPLDGLERDTYNGSQSPPEKAAQVSRNPNVRYAEPNHVWHPATDDPDFDQQWGFHNTGQFGGTPDADIDLPEARTVASDSDQQVVGVIDTGVQPTHEDLADHMWTNPGEIPDNGVDDDGNGYVDDVHGWDFHHDDASVYDEADMDEHGTHVAGTIAAVSDNQKSGAGTSDARIMALKFLGPDGGFTSNALKALDYALDMQARGVPVNATNNSWGGGGHSQAMEDKIEEANAAGQLFVAAAGNDGVNIDSSPSYPSSYPNANVVSVAATTHTDGLASFSNYGASTVDLGAPGASILSTVPGFGKAILAEDGYRSALHTFGLEGVLDSADREVLLTAALTWTATGTTDPVLVVDDDGGESFEGVYTSVLGSLGYGNVDVVGVPTGGKRTSRDGLAGTTMSGYAVVVWFTGSTYGCTRSEPTLTATDQIELGSYLDGGGNLLLFGQDIGFDLTGDGSTENAFLRDHLRADYLADADFNHNPVGQADTPYAGVPTIELDPADPASSSTGQRWSSALIPRTGAVAGLRGGPTDWFSGTSMASPHVAGAAAGVFASYPGIGHLEVKTRLMDQGDAVSSLDGKTVSGKRLNLAGALNTSRFRLQGADQASSSSRRSWMLDSRSGRRPSTTDQTIFRSTPR